MMAELNAREWSMLNGLRYAMRAYLSASEHNEAMDLCERGYARAWTSSSGPVIWEITEKGRETVGRLEGTTLT